MTEQNQLKKIMVCGNSLNLSSGLSYVAASVIIELLSREYEVGFTCLSGNDTTSAGIAVQGEKFLRFANGRLILFNAQLNSKNPMEKFNAAITQFNPDMIISIHDPWWLDCIAYSEHRSRYTWIIYPTIESPEYPAEVMFHSPLTGTNRKSILHIMSCADRIIPVSEMGRKCLMNMGLDNVDSPVFEGVELEDKAIGYTKEEVFSGLLENSDFLFMTMGLNTDRKKIDRSLFAFSDFLERVKGSKKYKMYVHTDTELESGGTDLRTLTHMLGLQEHVLIPNNTNALSSISRKELYKRYCVSDCYVGLPGGEGFGMGFAEAILHNLPIVYGTYGAQREYCHTCGLPAYPSDYFMAKNGSIKFALIDTSEAGKAMYRIATDPKLREGLVSNTEGLADRLFNWTTNMDDFMKVAERVHQESYSILRTLPMRRLI